MITGSKKSRSHETFERDEDLVLPSERNFGITISIVLFLLFVIPVIISGKWHWWALTISASFALPALFQPKLLALPNRLWYKFGLLMHGFVSPILLGLMFGFIIIIGLIRRLFNRDPLKLRYDRKSPSYWVERNPHGPNVEDFPRQF